MFVVSSYVSCNITEICFFAILNRLFQQSIYDLPLGRNDFSIYRYNYIYGGSTQYSEVVN